MNSVTINLIPSRIHLLTKGLTRLSLHGLSALLACFTLVLQAQQPLYFNPPGGGSGTWDSSSTNWGEDPLVAPTSAWPDGTATETIANFSFADGSVTVTSGLSSGGLHFLGGNYTLSSSSLTAFQLNEDRTIHVDAGLEATLGTNFRLMAPGQGSVGFTKTGSGTLIINGPAGDNNRYFGDGGVNVGQNERVINVNAGTLQMQSQSLSNTQHIINVAAGATLEVLAGFNVGGLTGSGTITGNQRLFLRGKDQDFSGVLTGNVGLALINSLPEQILSGSQANTFTDTVEIRVGTLVLAKDANVNAVSGSEIFFNSGTNIGVVRLENNEQISTSTNLRYQNITTGTSTFDLNGYSERLGNLVLDHPGNAGPNQLVIDFGDNEAAQYLWFNELVIANPSSTPLTIVNFDEDLDQFRFDNRSIP